MTEQQILDDKIESFWKWFVQTEDRIKRFFSEDAEHDKSFLIELLDNRILDFGLFKWEIGPADNNRYYLTISPNGNKKGLLTTKRIMESAPHLPTWILYSSKPSKEWDWKFSLYDDFMVEQTVDAFPWIFALQKYPNSSIEVFLEAANIDHLDEDTKLNAANIVIINTLGEENKISYIKKINIVSKIESERYSIFPIKELQEQFEKLLNY